MEVGRDSPLSISIKQKQNFINISVFQTTYETKHEHLEKQEQRELERVERTSTEVELSLVQRGFSLASCQLCRPNFKGMFL